MKSRSPPLPGLASAGGEKPVSPVKVGYGKCGRSAVSPVEVGCWRRQKPKLPCQAMVKADAAGNRKYHAKPCPAMVSCRLACQKPRERPCLKSMDSAVGNSALGPEAVERRW